MSSEESPSSSTYHPSDLPSSLSDTIPTDYDEEAQQSQPPSTDDEPPIPTTTPNSTTTPSSIDHKFHLLETRLSGFAESLLGIATCLDSLQQQITSLSSSLSLSSTSTSLQKEKEDDDDENSRLEEDKRELVVDGQEREKQKGMMMGEEKEEVGGEESNEDEAEDTAEQRPEGGGDGKVNNEGFLGEVISGILNGGDGEVES